MPWNEPGSNNDGSKDPWGDKPNKPNNQNRPKKPQRKGDSPPDLDDLINELKDKFGIGRAGGGRKRQSGGGGGSTGGSGRRFGDDRSIFAIAIIALIGLLLFNSFYTVQADQEAVIFRFGQYTETKGEGLHLKFPFADSVEIVSTTVIRQVKVGQGGAGSMVDESRMVTEDVNIVIVPFSVQFDIKDPAELLLNVADDPDINTVVKQATESAVREVVGRSKMDYVLIDGREAIDAEAADLAQQILDRYKTGINIISIETQGVKPPDEVKDAFDDFTRALEDRDRLQNEAQAYSNDVVPRSQGQATRILENAGAYKDAVIAKAQGEARRFDEVLAQYRLAPEVTRERLYIESIESVLGQSSKIIVDQSGDNVLFLPLDQMRNSIGNSSSSNEVRAALPSVIGSRGNSGENSNSNGQIMRNGREGRN